MFKEISPGDAQRLKDFFSAAGFDEANLGAEGFLKAVPSPRSRNLPRLLDRTQEPTQLNTLLRWFWIGVSQDAARAAALPAWFMDLALSVGLLRPTADGLISDAMLYPCDGFLAICDHTTRMGSSDPDFVLWPNPTTHLLSRFTMRRPSRATLDLGTGNAMQALQVARHSEQVVATDLNPRAINYAKFAAALNDVTNVECFVGDGFAPVAGRKFDLIVSNPPFFIGPTTRHIFCDNPMDLDQFCRRFVKESPAYLEEGGYFQILCEWAQLRGQPWQERVAEWVEGIGCDAWILKGHTEDPADYAQNQLAVAASSPGHNPDSFQDSYNEYVGYYRGKNVEAIHDGIIALRRRSGTNWSVIEEFDELPKEPFGEAVLGTFVAQDFLRAPAADERLLAEKLKLAPSSRLEQLFEPDGGKWKSTSLTLRLTKGFPFCVTAAPAVAEFLAACDGSRTIGELIQSFAAHVDAPAETVQAECLGIIRKLFERGFVS